MVWFLPKRSPSFRTNHICQSTPSPPPSTPAPIQAPTSAGFQPVARSLSGIHVTLGKNFMKDTQSLPPMNGLRLGDLFLEELPKFIDKSCVTQKYGGAKRWKVRFEGECNFSRDECGAVDFHERSREEMRLHGPNFRLVHPTPVPLFTVTGPSLPGTECYDDSGRLHIPELPQTKSARDAAEYHKNETVITYLDYDIPFESTRKDPVVRHVHMLIKFPKISASTEIEVALDFILQEADTPTTASKPVRDQRRPDGY